jgi:hypothetical protein
MGPIIALDAEFATDVSSKVWATRRLPIAVPCDVPEHVAVFVHEFGHMLRFALEEFAPDVILRVEGAVLQSIGIEGSCFDDVLPTTTDAGVPVDSDALMKLRDAVGIYASQSSHELWAELFLESHTRQRPRPAARVFNRELRRALGNESESDDSTLGWVEAAHMAMSALNGTDDQ